MVNARELYLSLRRKGVTLTPAAGDRLEASPASFLTAEEVALVRAAKTHLLALLWPPPTVMDWRVGEAVIHSLFGRPPDAPDVSARVARPWVPWGATAWRRGWEVEWHPMVDLPARWGLTHCGHRDLPQYETIAKAQEEAHILGLEAED